MKDRVPAPGKANRVKITQDDGTVVEGVLSYADDATQEGSAYNKANVLPDDVCETLGLNGNVAEPKDAFIVSSSISGNYGMLVVMFKTSSGIPVRGGFITVDGQDIIAGDNGLAGLALAPGEYTVTVTSALDMNLESDETISAIIEKGTYSVYYAEVSELSITQVTITTSTKACLSNRIQSFDIFAVAAGGSGAASATGDSGRGYIAAGGGAGGNTQTKKNASNQVGLMIISIGSGGNPVTVNTNSGDIGAKSGNDGGNTTITINGETIITAYGGEGGNAAANSMQSVTINGADGGSGSSRVYSGDTSSTIWAGYNGSDGGSFDDTSGGAGQGFTTTAFQENVGTQYSPAGGSAWGSGINHTAVTDLINVNGGGVYGKYSKDDSSVTSLTGYDAITPGGGGGAAIIVFNINIALNVTSGAGADGLVIIRWEQ